MTIAETLQLVQRLPESTGPSEAFSQLLPPASAAALRQLEQNVGTSLPAELRELYQLSNGMAEHLRVPGGEEPLLIGYLLMPAAANRRSRQQPQTPMEAALLVIAPPYVGGWCGYCRAELPATSAAIYGWQPVEDELRPVADCRSFC